MGTLSYELGDFNSATGYFESALVVPPTQGPVASAILDGLARVHLIQDRADSCLADLDQIESSIQTEQDRLSYEHRYAALTRVHLLAWQGHIDEALAKTDMVLDLAARAGDGLLHKQVQLTKAELLQRAGQIPSAMTLIAEIVPDLVGVSPELYGHSEQILACALASTGDPAGQAHHDRARRIYHAIGSVPRQRQLAAHWDQAREAARSVDAPTPEPPDVRGARQALHGIATAFTHASRPDLVAAELLEILNAANCTLSARAIVQSAGATVAADDDERRLSVGFKGDREIQLFIRPKPDIESVASVSAVALLLDSLHEVQRGRAEREERATLWPIEELPVEDERSVISGRMRELMSYARRIARTKVNVLITGESGARSSSARECAPR